MKLSQEQAACLHNAFEFGMTVDGNAWAATTVTPLGQVIVLTGKEDQYTHAVVISGSLALAINPEALQILLRGKRHEF